MRLSRGIGIAARGLIYVIALSVLILAAAGVLARFWLPGIADYRTEISGLLSKYLDQEITMTSLDAEWEGLTLIFKAGGVRVEVEGQSGPGMHFGEIYVSFNPLSLLTGGSTYQRLALMGPTIEAARLPDGRFRIGDTVIGTPRGLVRRLLQGENLEVTNGTLLWRDALAPGNGGQQRISDLQIRVRPQGDQRLFQLRATPPPELMRDLAVTGSYDSRSLDSASWTVAVDVSVEHLNLSRIPHVIQEQLPWQSHGHIDTDFHAQWFEGELAAASAELTATDFIIPYSRDKTPLSARRFNSVVSWRHSEGDWRLVFEGPEILLDEKPVSVSRFELRRSDAQRTYRAEDVNLRDLLDIVDRMEIDLPWGDLIDRLNPSGVFSQAALTLTGPYLEAMDWRFEGDFRNAGWSAQDHYPGVRGIDGHMLVDDTRGELTMSSNELTVDASNLLTRPVSFDRVEGRVEWYRWGRDWVVDVSDGVLANADLVLQDLNFYTRLPTSREESPFILARSRIESADIKSLREYLPRKRMTDKQIKWLDRALAGGTVTRGRFYMNGPLAGFPYRNGGGELQVSARIEDGVLDFNRKWPDLQNLDGVIELKNSRFEAWADKGMMMNSPIREVRVRSDNFFRRDRLLQVTGTLEAKVDDVVRFLRRGPLIKNPPPEYRRMTGRGEGVLELDIELPFTRLKEASRVTGRYRFDAAAVEVMKGVEFTQLAGTVNFTERTVEGFGLSGQVFGGSVSANLVTVEAGRPMTFALNGSGEADVSQLTPVVGPVLSTRLEGRTGWSGRFVGGPGPNRLEVSSDLLGVNIRLPDPLWKAAEATAPLDVEVEFERNRQRINVGLRERLSGELHYTRDTDRQILTRGVLNLGGDQALPENELVVNVQGRQFDMDQWIDEIEKLRKLRERTRAGDQDALFDHLRLLVIDVEQLRYLRRDLGQVKIRAVSGGNQQWQAEISGSRLEGTGMVQLDRRPSRYAFEMDRLFWPRLSNIERAVRYKPSQEPSEFAHVVISARNFRYGDMSLGRLDFEGRPERDLWRIHRLTLRDPHLNIDASGWWSTDRLGVQRTRVRAAVRADDFGRALAQLGMEDQVAKGTASVNAELDWPGAPGDFRQASLGGQLSFNARDGRFLNLEPGSGRLLGLFNVESLSRRLKLDFTDVFKEGLAFDRIDGNASIAQGELKTDGIFIIGPAALMELTGSLSLVEETYNLGVTVAPQLGANISLASAIANPAAGALIFVMQKLFKKQMAKLIHYKYRVTGGWDDPQVETVEQPSTDAPGRLGRN